MTGAADAGAVLAFWREAGEANWFQGGPAFDAQCRERFTDAHHAAARGELDAWMEHAEGALALVLLLDQMPRNLFRHSAHAFATDPLARRCAMRAIAAGHDAHVEDALRVFFYMPFEHSEDLADQAHAVALIEALGSETYTKYAHAHRDAILRFGRFPHRNRELGREDTAEEQAYLEAGGGFASRREGAGATR